MPVLNWLTRDDDIVSVRQVPYRLLEEVPEFSAGISDSGNMLIQGDNLETLKALLPFYAESDINDCETIICRVLDRLA